jgi:hypothetical protein
MSHPHTDTELVSSPDRTLPGQRAGAGVASFSRSRRRRSLQRTWASAHWIGRPRPAGHSLVASSSSTVQQLVPEIVGLGA